VERGNLLAHLTGLRRTKQPASTPDGPMNAEALTSALSEPIDPNEIETADRSIAAIDPSIEAIDPSIDAADRARQSDLG